MFLVCSWPYEGPAGQLYRCGRGTSSHLRSPCTVLCLLMRVPIPAAPGRLPFSCRDTPIYSGLCSELGPRNVAPTCVCGRSSLSSALVWTHHRPSLPPLFSEKLIASHENSVPSWASLPVTQLGLEEGLVGKASQCLSEWSRGRDGREEFTSPLSSGEWSRQPGLCLPWGGGWVLVGPVQVRSKGCLWGQTWAKGLF